MTYRLKVLRAYNRYDEMYDIKVMVCNVDNHPWSYHWRSFGTYNRYEERNAKHPKAGYEELLRKINK